jgi:putative spermidine/putrescine transport system ATP-binding protein
LTMSDRVAIFESGAIVQIGTPDRLYKEPATAFVASFIGENNSLNGIAERVGDGRCVVAMPTGLRATALAVGHISQGAPVHLTIRPEQIGLSVGDGQSDNRFQATVDGRIYHGDHQRLLARLANGQILTVKVGADSTMATGETIDLCWPTAESRAFPAGDAAGGNPA